MIFFFVLHLRVLRFSRPQSLPNRLLFCINQPACLCGDLAALGCRQTVACFQVMAPTHQVPSSPPRQLPYLWRCQVWFSLINMFFFTVLIYLAPFFQKLVRGLKVLALIENGFNVDLTSFQLHSIKMNTWMKIYFIDGSRSLWQSHDLGFERRYYILILHGQANCSHTHVTSIFFE